MQITQLPLKGELRARLIEFSNEAFLTAARRASCVRKVKNKWNAESYLDQFVDGFDLPLSADYLESLIEATIIHHVIGLVEE